MQFKVLGSLEVVADGRTVTPRPAKLRSALAMFCVKSGAVVSCETLATALWSGSPPRTARTALQVYVSKLRKYLDSHAGLADRLITRPHGYLLELETAELDLLEFDRLAKLADSAAAAGHVDDALGHLMATCSLWRGPALADLRGLPTFDKLARQLDERRIGVLERRIDLQLRLGQHRSLISELYGLVDEYPMWEAVYARLMISLYRSGRIAEALEVYRGMRDSLVTELGLEPGGDIRRLQQSILARDPALDEQWTLPTAG